MFFKKNNKKKKQNNVRKIYKTTDGFFTSKQQYKKPRRVAVIYQRKDDGALALVKIYSKNGKNLNSKAYIKNFTLSPEKHSSLTTDSIVDSRYIIGRYDKGKYSIIIDNDLSPTNDELTRSEHRKIKRKIGNKDNHKTQVRKLNKWKKHFRK